MVVMKFGGKSLDSLEKVNNICNYIKTRSKNEEIIVVVSAIGNQTNELINLAKTYNPNPSSRELDALLATGEMQSACLFCMALEKHGINAISLNASQIPMHARGQHLNSKIRTVETQKLEEYCYQKIIPVITGFQGVNEKGELTTLGRGGSDTTAVAVAAALNCKAEIYSDFIGIFAGDPRRANYKKFDSIDYDSMLLYAQAGAKVLSESAALLAKQKGVKIECKGSQSPESQGTYINKTRFPFKAINVNENEISLIFNNCILSKEKLDKCLKQIRVLKLNASNNSFKILTKASDAQLLELALAQEYKLLQ